MDRNEHENGINRLFRIWPQIVKLKYQDDPDLYEANATPKAARAFYNEVETGSFWVGYPNNPDHVALACIIEAARHMCGMDPAGATRLLQAAMEEIETSNRIRTTRRSARRHS